MLISHSSLFPTHRCFFHPLPDRQPSTECDLPAMLFEVPMWVSALCSSPTLPLNLIPLPLSFFPSFTSEGESHPHIVETMRTTCVFQCCLCAQHCSSKDRCVSRGVKCVWRGEPWCMWPTLISWVVVFVHDHQKLPQNNNRDTHDATWARKRKSDATSFNSRAKMC